MAQSDEAAQRLHYSTHFEVYGEKYVPKFVLGYFLMVP